MLLTRPEQGDAAILDMVHHNDTDNILLALVGCIIKIWSTPDANERR